MHYKASFLQFLVSSGALRFGTFTLKSGRIAPYFINAGNFYTGAQLFELGQFYAACILEHEIPLDTLFGPAYKGIPLAVATAIALAENKKAVNFCYDRKEIKDHGEGGMFVGKPLEDGERVVIVEDVVTSGKAVGEVYPKLKSAAKVDITGMVITVDRKEKALNSNRSAVRAIYEEYGIPVYAIATIDDIIEGMRTGLIPGKEHLDDMLAYRGSYGA